jgi:hypothetical protein
MFCAVTMSTKTDGNHLIAEVLNYERELTKTTTCILLLQLTSQKDSN